MKKIASAILMSVLLLLLLHAPSYGFINWKQGCSLECTCKCYCEDVCADFGGDGSCDEMIRVYKYAGNSFFDESLHVDGEKSCGISGCNKCRKKDDSEGKAKQLCKKRNSDECEDACIAYVKIRRSWSDNTAFIVKSYSVSASCD